MPCNIGFTPTQYPEPSIAQATILHANGGVYDSRNTHTQDYTFYLTPGTYTYEVDLYENFGDGYFIPTASASITFYVKDIISVTNNFGSGSISVDNSNVSSGSQFQKFIGDNISLGAIDQTDGAGYSRIWNTSGTNNSNWLRTPWGQGSYALGGASSRNYTYTVASNDNGATLTADLKKVCNITFQNSFTGIGNGGTISVNGTQYNSPTSPFNVVEQNSISGYPDDNYTNNGINYYFDHWSNGSTSASTTFYPGDHTTYTAYYKGIASKSNFNFGFDLLRGKPIKMHWTDNPNPNVSYQVWRTTNYSHGVAQDSTLIVTVQKGVQSYTDNEYIFTGLSTDPAIYYDVKEYYSTEGTYSFPSWYTTKGELQPKIASSPDSKKSVESEIKEYSIACYPNPFNPTTTINYQLPKDGVVSIIVFDMLGNEVKTLVNGYRTAGSYNVSFNASNLPSGIYFYRIQTNNYFAVKKMMLLK